MDIAFIHPTHLAAGGDGATYTATKLVTELIDRGHELTVFCLQSGPSGVEINAEVTVLDANGLLPFNVEINRVLRRRKQKFERFDVVHSYKPRSIPAMIDIATATDAGTIVSLTAYGAVCPKNDLLYKNKTNCDRNGYRRCAACAAATADQSTDSTLELGASTAKWVAGRLLNLRQSRSAMGQLDSIDAFHSYTSHVKQTHESFGYPGERIHTIENVLDETFVSEPQTRTDEPIRLLYVGRLTPAKGADRILPIYQRVADQLSKQVTLTIAGDGELRNELAAQLNRNELATDVELLGHVPYEEMPALYREHDLMVSPQVWDEPFGRTYIEALASGTPVVASDSGAAAEILGNGGAVTDGSVEAMATAVVELVSEDRLADFSRHAVDQIERFRAETVVPKFERLYERVAAE